MQNHAIIRAFDRFELASRAREALLDKGFSAESVLLDVRSDEAGPVEGNFAVGNSPVESDEHVYGTNYARAVERGHCLVTVHTADPATAARAAAILAGFGARDPDPMASNG